MALSRDFQDMLRLLHERNVRYLVIGGLAFIFHGKPRYTKVMDLWIDPEPENVERANGALREFGSPDYLDASKKSAILQIGTEPNRIDLLLEIEEIEFDIVWPKRVEESYGDAPANFIDIDSLIAIKSRINHPRHPVEAATR
jgi:hypothetical protein